MRFLFLVLLLLVPAGYRGSAHPIPVGVITGVVIDAETSRPLAGATVTARQGDRPVRGDITDAKGRFSIADVPEGTVTVQVKFIGYEPFVQSTTVVGGRTTEVNANLVPTSIMSNPLEVIGESPSVYNRLPGAATKVDPRTIRLINPVGTQELLEYVPGINGFSDDGIGNSRISIGIRGLNPRRSSHVLILEDGVPIQPALYIYPNMYYNPPTERLDRLEVIKGAGTIEYGPHTMGGVINYITRRPRATFGGRGEINVGTNGYFSGLAEIGGWGNAAIQPELQLLFKRGDGFRENNTFNQYNGTFKVNILPDEDRSIYVKANVDYEVSNATYTGLTEHSFAVNPRFNPKKDDLFTVLRGALDILYTSQITDNLIGNTKAYVNFFDREWWRENDVFVKDVYDPANIVPVPYYETGALIRVGGGVDNYGNLRSFSVLGIEQSYDIRHSLFGGEAATRLSGRLHWERFKDDKQVGDAPDARRGIYYEINTEDSSIVIVGQSQHYETMALALAASEELRLGELTISPGVRFEVFEQEQVDRLQGARYSDKTSYVILPGLGVNYQIGDVNFFGGIHRGYTPPSSATLQIVNFGANASAGGLDLESEKSWNTELGARASFNWMAIEVAAYHVAIEDLVAAGRGTIFKNLGRVVTQGVEVGGAIRPSALLSVSVLPDINVAYTYLQTEVVEGEIVSGVIAGNVVVDISGNELPYSPRHTLTLGVSKEFGFGLSLRADAHYVDRVYTDFENVETTGNRGDVGPVPGYTVYSAGASYRIGNTWRVGVAAKNLTDLVYIGSRLHSSPGQPEANLSSGIIPGPRRQINLTVSYTLGE